MENDIKKIAVIGATGKAGRAVVNEALAKGYSVVAIARNPQAVQQVNGMEIRKADVMDVKSLTEAFKDIDAVISCLGPSDNLRPGNLMSIGTKGMVEACVISKVKRFIILSGVLQSDGKGLRFFDRAAIAFFRMIFRKVVKDKLAGEKIVQESSLDWVIVHATGLVDKIPKGSYIAGPNAAISLARPIALQDCAACLVDAVKESKWTRQKINLGM